MQSKWFAHSGNGPKRDERFETIFEHVDAVTQRASQFAAAFKAEEQARAAGLFHDLGKYSPQFQRRLQDWREPGRDHWTLGAWALLGQKKASAIMPALAILGHHAGLPSLDSLTSLNQRLSRVLNDEPHRFTTSSVQDHQAAMKQYLADGFEMPRLSGNGLVPRHSQAADMLDTRMLFSALVDADFVETEAHFEGDFETFRRPRDEGAAMQVEEMIAALDRYAAKFLIESPSTINALRQRLAERCVDVGATHELGAFTLSAPTGFGKTIAMLRFALEHARKHTLRRIVVVMPFLNIIDQTAAIYREIFPPQQFGDGIVLESHSAAGCDVDANDQDSVTRAEIRRRVLSQNWDAPIVLTTNVQLLESLHAHRPSRCRKLHRLAGSVILFDEVQTLPPKLAVATLATLSRLCDPSGPFRTSVLFATATQPAFESLSKRVSQIIDPIKFTGKPPTWQPVEINDAGREMFDIASTRVRVRWEQHRPVALGDLAKRLAEHRQSLCIVNLKRHAIDLALAVAESCESVLHLSTNMTLGHRTQVLNEVRKRLSDNQPIHLFATQCVEAGVDLDFPVVMRALAPLEAIAQAAGRCNRNGRRPTCEMTVFSIDDRDDSGRARRAYPPGYDAAVSATNLFVDTVLSLGTDEAPEILNDPDRMSDYFRLFYALRGRDRAQQPDEADLLDAIRAGDFAKTEADYRLIDQNMIHIVVPYDRESSAKLIKEATEAANERGGMTPKQIRRWQRLASAHAVSVYRPRDDDDLFNRLLSIHFGYGMSESSGPITSEINWWYPTSIDCYDNLVGLQLAETNWVM